VITLVLANICGGLASGSKPDAGQNLETSQEVGVSTSSNNLFTGLQFLVAISFELVALMIKS
jgi:hypothetical protein